MNRDILFIVIIFILVISGIYFVFFSKGADDPSFGTLRSLSEQTGIKFSNISVNNFTWIFETDGEQSGSKTIVGKGFSASGASNKDIDSVKKYFEENGFKVESFNVDPSTLSGNSGYKKEKAVCVLKTTIWKDEQGMPMASDKFDVSVSCGELEQ
ncbi:MAG: hypothetical protein WC998_02785 [Candidatus Paceibacterota bacterium]|jgi:hypothetical protein